MDRIATYLRISNKDSNDDESNSIKGQRKLIQNFIDNNKEFRNISKIEFLDDGYSGKNLERPNFKKLYNYIEQGKVTTLIVKDRSRIGRNLLEVGEFTENFLVRHNVRLICILDNIDTKEENKDDMLKKAMYDLMNELYREDISNKVKKGYQNKMKNGTLIMKTPLGYTKQNGKVIVVPKDAEIVRTIFNLYVKHKNLKKICEILNNEKISTQKKLKKSAKIHIWNPTEVGRILKNTNYYGLHIYNKGKKEDKHIYNYELFPPIIEESLFNEVQNIRQSKYTKSGKYTNIHKRLEYVLHCSCGALIEYRVNSNDEVHCNCSNALVGIAKNECVEQIVMSKKILDNKVLSILKRKIKKEKEVSDNSKKQVAKLDKEVEKIRQKIITNENDFKKLYVDYTMNMVDKQKFEINKNKIIIEKKLLNSTLNKLNKNINYYLTLCNNTEISKVVLEKELIRKYIIRIILTNTKEIIFKHKENF